jgi:NADPH:quinone reductase-like Zn-dependent oxidoreductase
MRMKAIICPSYGSPSVLQLQDVDKPLPREDEVLIKVRAASVNPLDWHMMRGSPHFVRLVAGLLRPKDKRTGVDVAGQVEAVGGKVTQFKPGDEVFGCCKGAFAEYACAAASTVALKPANLTFEQAAAVPVAAFTALQGLRDKGKIQPGHKVLINGAAGGVGTFAVQIAKSFGAQVTGVCSTRNVEMVRSLGADHVIDYTGKDFTQNAQTYDLLIDCIGNHSLSACRRVLHPKGTYVVVGSNARGLLGPMARLLSAILLSRFVSQNLVGFIAQANKEDLNLLRELILAGKITPVIDRSYSLKKVPEAIRYLETGHAQGKVAITLG